MPFLVNRLYEIKIIFQSKPTEPEISVFKQINTANNISTDIKKTMYRRHSPLCFCSVLYFYGNIRII